MTTSSIGLKKTVSLSSSTSYPIPGSPSFTRRVTCTHTYELHLPALPTATSRACRSPLNSAESEEAARAYFDYIGHDYDPHLSLTEQVAEILQSQITERIRAHSHDIIQNYDLYHFTPKGVTHLLLHNFAKMLYPGFWNEGAKDLIRLLLTHYKLGAHLQGEHVDQILVLLQHSLEQPLLSVQPVHPSLEELVRITVALPSETAVELQHVCQALLCTLLSCVRQRNFEGNCVIVGTIPYLIGNHPKEFLHYLSKLLSRGFIQILNHQVSLSSFLVLMELDAEWKALNNITVSQLSSVPIVQDALRACSIHPNLSSSIPNSPPVLFQEMTAMSLSPQAYSRLCLRLQGYKENLLLRLFILSTETWALNVNLNHSFKNFLINLKRRVCMCLTPLSQKDALYLAKELDAACLFFCVPEAYFKHLMDENLSRLNGEELKEYKRACSLPCHICLFDERRFHLITSPAGLISALDKLMTKKIRSFLDTHHEIDLSIHDFPPLSNYLCAKDIVTWSLQSLPHLSELSVYQRRLLTEVFLDLDYYNLYNPGSHCIPILKDIIRISTKQIVDTQPKAPEALMRKMHQLIQYHTPHRLPPYICLALSHDSGGGHHFNIHLTDHHPLALSCRVFQDKLDQLKKEGQYCLSQRITREQLSSLVGFCYPNSQDAEIILARLFNKRIFNLKSALLAILAVVDPIDRKRVAIAFNDYYSSYLPSRIPFDALLTELRLPLDPTRIQQHFIYEAHPQPLHPYHICRLIQKVLMTYGYHVSTSRIQQSLSRVAQIKQHLEIGDLNHYSGDAYIEGSLHMHLILEFDLATEELCCYRTSEKGVDKIFYNGQFKLILPYDASVFAGHIRA
ncbi:MAG: hypothetical protein JSS62_06790 [Verrucomicrobia bacterium]|nr:hypothetical protein [Verrucomicrobiota bacterium]MBS0645573.1 hypothetical protein [Verrucomicrobiota bacterium]